MLELFGKLAIIVAIAKHKNKKRTLTTFINTNFDFTAVDLDDLSFKDISSAPAPTTVSIPFSHLSLLDATAEKTQATRVNTQPSTSTALALPTTLNPCCCKSAATSIGCCF